MITGLVLTILGESIILFAFIRWHRACVRVLVDQAATATIEKDRLVGELRRANDLFIALKYSNASHPTIDPDVEWLLFARSL